MPVRKTRSRWVMLVRNDKKRQGSRVVKRYEAPTTPCAKLLASQSIEPEMKERLRGVGVSLDPLRLLDEIRSMQRYLASLSDGSAVGVAPWRGSSRAWPPRGRKARCGRCTMTNRSRGATGGHGPTRSRRSGHGSEPGWMWSPIGLPRSSSVDFRRSTTASYQRATFARSSEECRHGAGMLRGS